MKAKNHAVILIVLAGILWGTSGIFVSLLAPFGFTSMQMTCVRSLVAFICIFIYILLRDKALLRASLKELLLYLGCGFGFWGTATCYFLSMQMTSIATAVVLMYTAPILVLVYSVIFLGEKLTWVKGICVAVMLLGCGLVSGIVGGLEFNLLGILIGVLSGICYSIYNIFTKYAMKNNYNALTTVLYSFLFATLLSLCFGNPGQMLENVSQAPVSLLFAIGLGVMTCILPYTLYTLGLKELPAGTASALGIVEPMSATFFGIMLGQNLTLYSAAGMILIVGAVLVLSKSDE